MAPHSSALAWTITGVEEPGGLQFMGSRTRLSNFTFTLHFHALEKEMATHSSVLARRIPGTREPGGLPSMGSHRVGHDWSDLAAAAKRSNHLKQTLVPELISQSSHTSGFFSNIHHLHLNCVSTTLWKEAQVYQSDIMIQLAFTSGS